MNKDSPAQDDEEIQPVPGLAEVSELAPDPHRNHLDQHLSREKSKDEIINILKIKILSRFLNLKNSVLVTKASHL